MKIRLFGVEGCEKCDMQKDVLEAMSIPYMYIDANADEHEALCDEQGVDDVPHIQLVYNDLVVHQHVGFVDPKRLQKVAAEIGQTIK